MNPDASLDWSAVYSQIEDFLIPGLRFDAWDRSLYYHHLLRREEWEVVLPELVFEGGG